MPLCHFQLSFDVFALCSHFSNPSGIWFLTSLHDGQWYSLWLSVPSSLLQPPRLLSSDHRKSFIVFCTHPPSTTSFLPTLRCLSVHDSCVFLRSISWIGSSQTPSFNSSHSCLAAGRPPSCPPPPVPQTARCAAVATGFPDREFRT